MRNTTLKLLSLVAIMLSFTLNASAQAHKVGDYVYDESGFPDGIICYVSEDGTQAMALSFVVKKTTWISKGVADTGDDIALPLLAKMHNIGQADDCLIYIKSQTQYAPNVFPAFQWAETLGDGWYIPSQHDWIRCIQPAFAGQMTMDNDKKIYDLQSELNAKMVEAGGQPFDMGDAEKVRYWTCNVKDDQPATRARNFRPQKGDSTPARKTAWFYARAVKYINM